MDKTLIWTRLLFSTLLLICATLIPHSAHSAGSINECPVALSTGQPACGSSNDIGSNAPSRLVTRHVGNPVDVVSGNKYQQETDVQSGSSKLSFTRHYNSSLTSVNVGIGQGWLHSYSVSLTAPSEQSRRVTQSDGRQIDFVLFNDGSSNNEVPQTRYLAATERDGYLLENANNQYSWYLPDGRKFSFIGSYLVSITFSDSSQLSLFYKNRRLHSVTDEFGKSLTFHYSPGELGLPMYEPGSDQTAAGHLHSIELPDGSHLAYRYSHQQTLNSVEYHQGIDYSLSRRYGYQDETNYALLTELADANGRVQSKWTYDDHGRVSSYRSVDFINLDGTVRGEPDLTLSYSEGESINEGLTDVRYRDGSRTEYRWTLDESRRVTGLSDVHFNAPGDEIDNKSRLANETQSRSKETYHPEYPEGILEVISTNGFGYPDVLHYTDPDHVQPHVIHTRYDRVGHLLSVRWQSGFLDQFDGGRLTDRAELVKRFQEINDTDGDRMEMIVSRSELNMVQGDARLFLLDSTKALEVGSIITGAELNQAWDDQQDIDSTADFNRRSALNTRNASSKACKNLLTNCNQIRETLDYAEVAKCAYTNVACNTRFVEADLGKLGIDLSDIDEGSFHADIFYDRKNDRYIVTFAGTEFTSIGDWYNNIGQEFGFRAPQYKKAVNLAMKLQVKNPNLKFEFTGHSLGGGLATAAAAAVKCEAYVFNPAALTKDAATSLGIDYAHAKKTAHIYQVDGEALTNAQVKFETLEDAPGKVHALPRPAYSWVQANINTDYVAGYNIRLGITLHGIDAVQQSLNESLKRYNCG